MTDKATDDEAMKHGYPWLPRTTRSLAGLAIGLVLAIAGLDVLGWLLHAPVLTSISPHWIPMKPVTAACFLLAATALALIRASGSISTDVRESPGPDRDRSRSVIRLRIAGVLGAGVVLFGLLTVASYYLAAKTGQEDPLRGVPLAKAFLSPGGRMALLTAILFVLAGSAVLLLTDRRRRSAGIAHAIAFPAAMASYLVPASYLLGVVSLHDWLGTPVALNTGIAFCALWVAVFAVRPASWFMSVFTGHHAGGMMARRLLPALLVLPLVIGWLRLRGEQVGIYQSDVGIALVAVAYTICFVWLVWLSARSVNRTDEQRQAAERAVRASENELRRFNAELEARIAEKTSELRATNETLEMRVAERTAELTAANDDLRASRRAALNITEDAIDACRRADQARADQARIARLYNVLSQVNETIVRTRERESLLQQACAIIAETGGFPLVWIGTPSAGSSSPESPTPGTSGQSPTPDRQRSAAQPEHSAVRPVAAAGEAIGYLEEVKVTVGGMLGRGPTGTAIRQNSPVINQDFDTNPLTASWRAPALKYGFRSSAAFPLTLPGNTVGALTLYSPEPGMFDPDQVRLLEALCADLSYALQAMEDDELRRRAEQGLREAKEKLELSAEELRRHNDQLVAAHDTLRKNQATLKSILDATKESIWLFSSAGITLMTNEIALRRFERAAGEVIGRHMSEILPPELARTRLARLNEVVVTGEPVEFEDARSGMSFRHSFYPVKDAGGRVAGVVSFSRDITLSRRAEEALQASEERFRMLIVQSPVAIAYVREGRTLYANPAYLRMFGFSDVSELRGRPLTEQIVPRCREEIVERVRRRAESEISPNAYETIGLRKDGSEFPFFVETSSVALTDGPATIAFFTDITERKRAEQGRRESEQRMARAQEIAHLGSWELNLDRNALTWSDEVYRIFGLQPQEFDATYEAFLAYVHPDDRAAVDNAYRGSVRDGRDGYEIEHRVVRQTTGEVRVVLERCQHIRDDAGKVARSVGMVLDITERKRAAEALARNEAEYREFTQLLAHSVKSPLSTIRLAAQQLDREREAKLSEVILEQVERLNRIALGMMYLSESRTHQRRNVDLNHLIVRALDDQGVRSRPGIEVQLSLEPGLPAVCVNEEQFVRILGNLVENAVTAMNDRGTLTVKTARAGNGRELVVEVSDTGPGIPAAYRDRLFQPFFTRRPGGTGLGLAIAKRIVEDHGGRIELSSEPETGARFSITLPAETGAEEAVPPARLPTEGTRLERH